MPDEPRAPGGGAHGGRSKYEQYDLEARVVGTGEFASGTGELKKPGGGSGRMHRHTAIVVSLIHADERGGARLETRVLSFRLRAGDPLGWRYWVTRIGNCRHVVGALMTEYATRLKVGYSRLGRPN